MDDPETDTETRQSSSDPEPFQDIQQEKCTSGMKQKIGQPVSECGLPGLPDQMIQHERK